MFHPDGESFFAPAKINLYLHVLGKRADGYHRLDSLVTFASVGDHVRVQAGGSGALTVGGPFATALADQPPEHNLVLRAAHGLATALKRPLDVDFHLEKRLPVASGIGGGSADAAAALRGLARLWGLADTDPRLRHVAFACGADVPVCLAGRPMVMRDAGETLQEPPPLPACPAVLLNPGLPLATPAVFRARHGAFLPPAPALTIAPANAEALIAHLAGQRNDLTAAAIALAPVIADVIAALAAQPGCRLVRLSGSGATVFGLFPCQTTARTAAAALQQARPDWWCVACGLGEAPPQNPTA